MENTVDGKFFVTARGWEDLSEILKSYEEMYVPVTEKLMVQYLQKEDIAKDFAVYYQLYCKYGEDYSIREIAMGSLDKEVYQRKIEMARKAAFEERFTVIGLLLSYMSNEFQKYTDIDGQTTALHHALVMWKILLERIRRWFSSYLDFLRTNMPWSLFVFTDVSSILNIVKAFCTEVRKPSFKKRVWKN